MVTEAALSTPGGYRQNQVAPMHTSVSTTQAFVLMRDEAVDISGLPSFARGGNRVVRRPLGIEWKKDTYAYIEALREETENSGRYVPMMIFNENSPVDYGYTAGRTAAEANTQRLHSIRTSANTLANGGGGGMATYANNFLIQSVNEVREEKFQLLETFGANYLFFFGERPRFLDVSGILLNSNSHRWQREWLMNYDRFLRGTKAVENKVITTLHVDGLAVSGYILTTQVQNNSEQPLFVNFSFRMLISDYIYEDEPVDTVNFFANNLAINNPFAGQPTNMGFDGAVGKVADAIGSGLDKLSIVTDNAITKAAVAIISQYALGSPYAATSEMLAATGSIASALINTTGSLGDLEAFRQGMGSLVEYGGQPIELYPINKNSRIGAQTLGGAGKAALLASVDNSLSILLNLSTSPIVRMVGSLGELIQGATNVLQASPSGWASKGMANYSEALGRGDRNAGVPLITGRYMGADFLMPFKGLKAVTINPEIQVNDSYKAATSTPDAYAYGDTKTYDFWNLDVPTGSGVKFDQLKADPNYELLPRNWKLAIERNPDQMSAKIIATSRKNSEDQMFLRLRVSKSAPFVESNVSEKLEELGFPRP